MIRNFLPLWLLCLFPLRAFQLTDHPLFLTSSFLESRGDRYHAGVDLSTEKKIGLPIYAPEKGWVMRIKVSPFGYGKALYFQGESGKLYVLAHLNGFAITVWEAAYQKMLAKKDVNLDWRPENKMFSFEKGQVIAYSGNTGIGEAHLHIEVRKGESRVEDPIKHGLEILDTLPPQLLQLAIYSPKTQNWSLYQPNQKAQIFIQPEDYFNLPQSAVQIVDYAMEPRENPMSINRLTLTQNHNTLFSKNYTHQYYGKMQSIFWDLYLDLPEGDGDWHLLSRDAQNNPQISVNWQQFKPSKSTLLNVADGLANETIYEITVLENAPKTAWKPTQSQKDSLIKISAPLNLSVNSEKLFYSASKDSLGNPLFIPNQKNQYFKSPQNFCFPSTKNQHKGIYYLGSKDWNSFSKQIRKNDSLCIATKQPKTFGIFEDRTPPKIGSPISQQKLWNHTTVKGIALFIEDPSTPQNPASGIGSTRNIELKVNGEWRFYEWNPEAKEIWIPLKKGDQTLTIRVQDDFGNKQSQTFELDKFKSF